MTLGTFVRCLLPKHRLAVGHAGTSGGDDHAERPRPSVFEDRL